MIAITKHLDREESLFARGATHLADDAILIDKILAADFPLFSQETEYEGGVANKKDSEFAISFSFLQSDVSVIRSDDILNFLRRGDRNYRYHIVISIGSINFSGTFKSEDIKYFFNFDDDKYKASIIAKGALSEFFEYTKDLTSVFSLGAGSEYSFESFLSNYLLDFIDVDFGGKTYNERLGSGTDVVFQQIYYGNTGTTNYTDWSLVSRWEFFYALSKGMGFDFDFVLKYSAEELISGSWYSNPLSDLYKIKIFFKTDITDNSEVYNIAGANVHNEFTVSKNKPYVLIISRQQVPDPAGLILVLRGVLYGSSGYYESDSSDSATAPPGNFAYPPYFLMGRKDGENYSVIYVRGNSNNTTIPFSNINYVEVPSYSNPIIQAYGQYIRAGSISPAHFFINKSGGQWHTTIARFAAQQYLRYVSGAAKKAKDLTVNLDEVDGIRLYSKVTLTDKDGFGEYYVSKIQDLSVLNRTVRLTVIQL